MKSRKARRRRYRSTDSGGSTSFRHNPPVAADLWNFVLPGFGGYAVSRVASRAVAIQVGKLKPSLGKHAGVIASLATFAAGWFLIHRWKPLAKYHTPLVVGAGIASLQTLVQSYLPMVGWVMDAPPSPMATILTAPAAAAGLTDDGNDYFSYNDAFDAGVYRGQPSAGADVPGSPQAAARSAQATDTLDDVMADLGADGIGMSDAGIFSN